MSLRTVLSVLLAALTAVACGDGRDPSPVSPPVITLAPAPPTTAYWRLQVFNDGGVEFAAVARIDGVEVYRQAVPAEALVADVTQPYVAGAHRVEFEIVSARRRVSTYRAAIAVGATPSPAAYYDGVPRTLAVGETMRLDVVLIAN